LHGLLHVKRVPSTRHNRYVHLPLTRLIAHTLVLGGMIVSGGSRIVPTRPEIGVPGVPVGATAAAALTAAA
jgi:hypothetical protein